MTDHNTTTTPLPPLVAVRADQLPPGTPIPPDVQPSTCADCGAAVLLSPSSRGLIAEGQARSVCDRCALAAPRGASGVVPGVPPGAGEDLRRWRCDEVRRN